MIIDQFKNLPDFPFNHYYKSPNQFIQAQQYWLAVLRNVPNFIEEEWAPAFVPPPEAPALNILDGQMFWIRNIKHGKEIMFHTDSYEGSVASYMDVNDGYTEEDIKIVKEYLDYTPSEEEIRGISREEAEKDVLLHMNQEFLIWVENNDYFQLDESHPERGYDVPVERLWITSKISEEAEHNVVKALTLFFEEGAAYDRINDIFAPDEE